MVERIAKTYAVVRRRGLLEDEPDDALARVQADSVQTGLPIGAPAATPRLAGFREVLERLGYGRVQVGLERAMHDGTRAVAFRCRQRPRISGKAI